MQFKKYAVVGVLITLYLSTDSWCRSIPESKNATNLNLADKKKSNDFQICGGALTDIIEEFCRGNLNSLSEVSSSSTDSKITEKCCSHPCTIEEFQTYCRSYPLFTPMKTFRDTLLNNAIRSEPSGLRSEEKPPQKEKNKGFSEVRVRKRKYGKKNWVKSKKRKRSFKRKCAYKSFGHYLLKLNWGNRVRNNMDKKRKKTNQMWRSIEIGTISPEMENFGGQPIVELKKNRLNSI